MLRTGHIPSCHLFSLDNDECHHPHPTPNKTQQQTGNRKGKERKGYLVFLSVISHGEANKDENALQNSILGALPSGTISETSWDLSL